MRVKLSPDAIDRLKDISSCYGKETAKIITTSAKGLSQNPNKGASVEKMLGIESPYYFLHIAEHYVFYRFDEYLINVTDIYHERENFIQKMFGISLRTDESKDYWGE